MSRSRLRPYLGPVIALLVVLALGAGTVYAAIPNGNGTYYACLVKNTGAVKLINYPKVKTCPKGQQLINWNAKGPQGPAGPQGVQGPKGDLGPAGASGSSNWGDIANKPADLADGQVGWGEVANKPGDFADGVDNEGVTTVTITRINGANVNIGAGLTGYAEADCPAGSLAVGGGYRTGSYQIRITDSWAIDADTWRAVAMDLKSGTFLAAYVLCQTVEPSGAIIPAAKGLKAANVGSADLDKKKRGK